MRTGILQSHGCLNCDEMAQAEVQTTARQPIRLCSEHYDNLRQTLKPATLFKRDVRWQAGPTLAEAESDIGL